MKTLVAMLVWCLIVLTGCFLVDYFDLWKYIFGFTIFGGLGMAVLGPFLDLARPTNYEAYKRRNSGCCHCSACRMRSLPHSWG